MPKKKVTLTDIPVVEVIWYDAEEIGDIGWNNLSDLRKESRKVCPTMRTVGYCLYHGPNHISVINTVGPDESSRLDKIPTGFIQSIQYLRGTTSDVPM